MLGFAWNIITKTPFNAVKPKPYGCQPSAGRLDSYGVFVFLKDSKAKQEASIFFYSD
jgi:hypothetical protein